MEDDVQIKWWALQEKLMKRFGKKPDMEAILFLVGLSECGITKKNISKEQKQDVMHVATCTVLSKGGYFEFTGRDEENWPHFMQVKPFEKTGLREQEEMLKEYLLAYFDNIDF